MKVEFISNLNSRYMTVCETDSASAVHGFVERMILENRIEGVLKANLAGINGLEIFCYDITGKTSVAAYVSANVSETTFFCGLLCALAGIQERLQRYLIKREAVMVLPEQIFYDSKEKQFYFGIWPSGSETNGTQWQKLAECLISGLSPGDQASARIVYPFYQVCITGEVTAAELKRIIESAGLYYEAGRGGFGEPKDAAYPHEQKAFRESAEADFSIAKKPLGTMDYSIPKEKKESPKKRKRDKKNKSEQSKAWKNSEKKSFLGRIITKFMNRTTLQNNRQKTEDKRYEQFFRSVMQSESVEAEALGNESQGTVLLSAAGFLNQRTCFVLEPFNRNKESIRILKDETILGREKEKCDIILVDITASRLHAKLIRNSDSLDLIDLGSKNGTIVNERIIPKNIPFALSDGDKITFGEEKYMVRIFAASEINHI